MVARRARLGLLHMPIWYLIHGRVTHRYMRDLCQIHYIRHFCQMNALLLMRSDRQLGVVRCINAYKLSENYGSTERQGKFESR